MFDSGNFVVDLITLYLLPMAIGLLLWTVLWVWVDHREKCGGRVVLNVLLPVNIIIRVFRKIFAYRRRAAGHILCIYRYIRAQLPSKWATVLGKKNKRNKALKQGSFNMNGEDLAIEDAETKRRNMDLEKVHNHGSSQHMNRAGTLFGGGLDDWDSEEEEEFGGGLPGMPGFGSGMGGGSGGELVVDVWVCTAVRVP